MEEGTQKPQNSQKFLFYRQRMTRIERIYFYQEFEKVQLGGPKGKAN